MGLTHLLFHQVKLSTLMPFSKQEANESLCIGETGVDLELCVHAHGRDVLLIMEASRKNNYPLVMSSSCICVSIIYNCGSDHIVLLRFHFLDKL